MMTSDQGLFRITTNVYTEILDHLDKGKKIAAIKALRRVTKCSLRPAKEAIERLEHEKFGKNYPAAARSGYKIYIGPAIKNITFDYGQGDVTIDLEGMQMITLMAMQETGLDVCRELLDFVDILTAYSKGKKIGIIDEDTDKDKF
jgi:hypothetical protein